MGTRFNLIFVPILFYHIAAAITINNSRILMTDMDILDF